MQSTYMIHVQLGDKFEDLYVRACSVNDAIAKARRRTTLDARWSSFTA